MSVPRHVTFGADEPGLALRWEAYDADPVPVHRLAGMDPAGADRDLRTAVHAAAVHRGRRLRRRRDRLGRRLRRAAGARGLCGLATPAPNVGLDGALAGQPGEHGRDIS